MLSIPFFLLAVRLFGGGLLLLLFLKFLYYLVDNGFSLIGEMQMEHHVDLRFADYGQCAHCPTNDRHGWLDAAFAVYRQVS